MQNDSTTLTRPIFQIFLFTVCAALSWGQSTSSLRGTVKDKQSGAVPEAVIELLRTDTGLRRNVTTDAAGEYQFAQLPPGRYSITANQARIHGSHAERPRTASEHSGDFEHYPRSGVGH